MRLINFKSITFQFALYLLIFGLISLADHLIFGGEASTQSFYFINIGIIAGIFICWYFFFKTVKKISLNYLNLTISAIILFLLIHPMTPWYYVALAAVVTLIIKMVVRYKGSPIFNPSALGLFVT